MDKVIAYIDDAAHAWQVLQPLLAPTPGRAQVQWILVACAPRVTHHVSKWVTHSARESWRGKWADKVFAQLVPKLQSQGDVVITVAGKNNLAVQTEVLMREHGPARVVDARRPKLGGHSPLPAASPAGLPRQSLLGMVLTLTATGAGVLAAAD